jgi:hypothetical protein
MILLLLLMLTDVLHLLLTCYDGCCNCYCCCSFHSLWCDLLLIDGAGEGLIVFVIDVYVDTVLPWCDWYSCYLFIRWHCLLCLRSHVSCCWWWYDGDVVVTYCLIVVHFVALRFVILVCILITSTWHLWKLLMLLLMLLLLLRYSIDTLLFVACVHC